MKFIGMFFLFFIICGCSHGAERKASLPLPAQEPTDKTPTTTLRRYEVLPAPGVEMLNQIARGMVGVAFRVSPRDQVNISMMIDVLKRANREEIASLVANNHIFPIEDIFQNTFWHAAIELGNVFLSRRSCIERTAYLEKDFFPKRLAYLPPEGQLVYRAAGQLLARHADLQAYRCEDKSWVVQ